MMKKYSGLKVVGVHNGYFDEKEEKQKESIVYYGNTYIQNSGISQEEITLDFLNIVQYAINLNFIRLFPYFNYAECISCR